MKVALCLFGQPRFLDNPYPFKSHKKHILDKYDVDCFSHLWWEDGIKKFDTNPWAFRSENCDVNFNDPVDIINNQYVPIRMVVEAPRTFRLSQETLNLTQSKFSSEDLWSERVLSNNSSHLYSIENSLKLIEEPNKYDFIILSRYDNYIHNFPNLYELDSSKFYLSDHHLRFPDLLYVFGSEYIHSQYTFSNIDYLADKYMNDFWEPSAECYKYFNFLDKFSLDNLVRIHLPIRVVRNNYGFGDLDQLPFKYVIKSKFKLFLNFF